MTSATRKPITRAAASPDPAICTTCNGTAHLVATTTGTVVIVNDPDDEHSTHPCVLGRPAALLEVDPATGRTTVALAKGGPGAFAHALGNRFEGGGDWAKAADQALRRGRFVVLRRTLASDDLYGGTE